MMRGALEDAGKVQIPVVKNGAVWVALQAQLLMVPEPDEQVAVSHA